jgi:hypothetical protein
MTHEQENINIAGADLSKQEISLRSSVTKRLILSLVRLAYSVASNIVVNLIAVLLLPGDSTTDASPPPKKK